MAIGKFFKNTLFFIIFSIISFLTYSIILVLVFKWVDPPTTAFIQFKSTTSIFASLSDYEYEWKSIDKVSLNFPLAVISSEDQIFFFHNGFDFGQIQKAIKDIETGRRFRGASTISQQTAKNLFLWSDQSFVRKGFEAYFTVLIELLWGKERILEVYINCCELGENVYGVEAASQKYFNKSSERLTAAESALLATVLPRPSRRNPASPSSYMLNRRNAIMRQMGNLGGKEFLEKNL